MNKLRLLMSFLELAKSIWQVKWLSPLNVPLVGSVARGPDACRRRPQNSTKRWLNRLTVDYMNAQQYAERNLAGKFRGWLAAIAEIVAGGS